MTEIIYDTSILIGFMIQEIELFLRALYPGLFTIMIVLVIPMILYTIYKILGDSMLYEGN